MASMRSIDLDHRLPIEQIFRLESESRIFGEGYKTERNLDSCLNTFYKNNTKHDIDKFVTRPEMNATRITLT